METHQNEQYVTFPLSGVHDTIQENIISHEEICEPVDECVLQEGLTEVSVTEVNPSIAEAQVVEILAESDEESQNRVMYPIYIKQEEQPQYTSGDDESMAVEALRQLGGMYPCVEDKKVSCPNCMNLFTQAELAKHRPICGNTKLCCVTCGERFERKIDLDNHIVCHQVDRPHACRICGNLFRSKNNLRSHLMQMHQVERPFKCDTCGADFQRPSSLTNHTKIHSYIAGRALMETVEAQESSVPQSEESFRSWPENLPESQNAQVTPSSVEGVQSYEPCQVQWNIPSYTFANDQTNVNTVINHQDKMDTLQEFTVMSNGEVAQFEYPQQNNINNDVTQQYSVPIIEKVETVVYERDTKESFPEIESSGAKQQTCKHCGVGFSCASTLAAHESSHIKSWGMPIECEYCDKQFQDANYLATHQTTCAKKLMQNNLEQGITNNKWAKHACSECGKKFTTKQKMFRHQWIHRKKTHSCEVCGSQFEKQHELDEHRLAAHPGDSPFPCTECGKSFVSRQGLWEHNRTHAGSPAHFQCSICLKTFSSRQGHLIHNRTHTGERPYGCKFCWKAFRDGGTLRKHERIHTGERPHVCPLCSRAFNQKVVLREHVRWVHAAGKNETEDTGPPFPCPLCGTLNQDRDELCAHIVKHSDQMIAEAKAKTNDSTPKSPVRKKTRLSSNTCTQGKQDLGSRAISSTEQNQALLSITQRIKSEDQEIGTDKSDDAFLVVSAEKQDEGFIAVSQIRSLIGNKRENDAHFSQSSETTDTERSALHSTTRENEIAAMHLIQTSKTSNTLHLISKQNESLPVLTIRNPQGHENFSSQITQVNVDRTTGPAQTIKSEVPDETTIQEHVTQTAVIQVVQYHHQESDDGEELTCGICGEDFTDKNVLMEHVKIHI